MVRDEFPAVRLFEFENHGFAHAVNRGLAHATRDHLLLLNSDLFVTRQALVSMLDRLASHPAVGAVAPVLTNEDGSRQFLFGAFYWPNFHPIRKVLRVPLLHAACLMTRRDVVQRIGALDETFFLYNEEFDFCARALRAGYRLEIVPERVVHVGGGSTPPTPDLTFETQRGFLYLMKKHMPSLVVRGVRRIMLAETALGARFDPRPAHREMWMRLASLSERSACLESPFPLSGRGDAPAQPDWLEAARVPLEGERPVEDAGPPAAEGASVVRLADGRARVSARRAGKRAGASN